MISSGDGQASVFPSKYNDLLEQYKAGKLTLEEFQAEVAARLYGDKRQAAENRKLREEEQIKKDLIYFKDRVKFYQRTTLICLLAFIIALVFATNYKNDIKEKNETIRSLASEAQTKYENANETVYVTDTGSAYHRSRCSYLRSRNEMSLETAIDAGYHRCSKCKPPVLKEIE